jgi:hypothetical protein
MDTLNPPVFDVIEVARAAPAQTRQRRCAAPSLAPGEVRLATAEFALTANNATYALLGERFRYFDFFPTDDRAYALVPVWGYAQVVESACPGVEFGEWLYGFLPMASQWVIAPTRLSASRLFDGAAARAELPAVYQWLQRPGRDGDCLDPLQPVLQPLAQTAFLLREHVASLDPSGTRPLLFSSASSKTALATALMFSRDTDRPRPPLIGLTSPANVPNVRAHALFNAVCSYAELAEQPPIAEGSAPILLDFAGHAGLREQVHQRGGADSLSLLIGMTHGSATAAGRSEAAAAAVPRQEQLFFAPSAALACAKAWGAEVYEQRFDAAWLDIQRHFGPHLQLHRQSGAAAIVRVWDALMAGRLPADEAHLLRFGG